jgi:hypothetical protein
MVYDPPHAAFHMSKFLANLTKRYVVEVPQAVNTTLPGEGNA